MNETKKNTSPVIKALLFLALLVILFVSGVMLLLPNNNTFIASSGDGKVALVRIEGVIVSGEKVVDQIEKWADDDSVDAIVLRIVSPGGVVAPSQEIYTAVRNARKQKKVVASMGAVAASGGYYIAAACDKIVAMPGSITGSIGVIMMFNNTYKLFDKIGLGSVVIKSGQFKDTGSPHRPITKDERALMQTAVNDIQTQFVEDVAEGRGMEQDLVRNLADGRIYTGKQAHKEGLVDKLGTLGDAVSLAGKLAGVEGEPDIVEERDKLGFLEKLLGEEYELKFPFSVPMNLQPGFYFIWPAAI